MASASLQEDLFLPRLKKFYEQWKNEDDATIKSLDCICLAIGSTEDVSYAKSIAFQIWLFGYELPDTICLFTKQTFYFCASKKKVEFFRPAEKWAAKMPIKLSLLLRDKDDQSVNNFKVLTDAMQSGTNSSQIGEIVKEKIGSKFIDTWRQYMSSNNPSKSIDISSFFSKLLAVKDDRELANIKKAAAATGELYSNYLKKQIVEIIDGEKQVKHIKLADNVEDALQRNASRYITSVTDVDNLETCYKPILQSGGEYQLKFSVTSDKRELQYDSIISMLGLRYRSYCANIGRTIMFEPDERIQKNYEFLLKLEEFILSELTNGVTFSRVYNAAMEFARREVGPEMVEKLIKIFGFVTGLEFRDSNLVIGPKTDAKIRAGMVLVITVGFQDLVDTKHKRSCALFISDTVTVSDTGAAQLLTPVKKGLKNSAIFLREEESEEDEKKDKRRAAAEPLDLGRGKRTAILDSKTRSEAATNEDKRLEHQQELFERIQEQAKERLQGLNQGDAVKKKGFSIVSYRSVQQLPSDPDIRNLKPFVDRKNESIILPIFGCPTPFHIATIKNVSNTIEADYIYVRINFFHPGAAVVKDAPIFETEKAIFLKEVTFRSTAGNGRIGSEIGEIGSLMNAFRLIREMQKRFRTHEAEEREKEGVIEQDQLVLNLKGNNLKLKDLYMRPNLAQKRIAGSLEAHLNGFRFTSIRGDKVDILFNNIKHAFYQPCDGEMIILLHFHLKNPIMFGKKKQSDVQFYHEVGEMATDLGKGHLLHDKDDLYAEQAEREYRNKLKAAFRSFTDKVRDMTKGEVDFDTPFRELGFNGAPFRSTVLLQPTSGCLVNLTEWPPFVISLDEVELVHFERVQFQLKSFDMVFVFKDYHRKVAMINSIPMTHLEHIKEWLNSCDIFYSEGIQSLNWVKIMKTITDDPEEFFDQGGWTFLKPESDAEDEQSLASEDEDGNYVPSGASDDGEESGSEEGSDEDSGSDEDWSAEDSGSEQSLDSNDSSGKDWDELEEEAKKADKESYQDDTEDTRRSRKRKAGKENHSPAKHPRRR